MCDTGEKVFLSDKYSVAVHENGDFTAPPVYISLLSDGTENNIKLPQEIYNEYDGLGQGTRTVKTYFTTFEFKEKAVVRIAFPDGVKSVAIKPEGALAKYEFSKGVYTAANCEYITVNAHGVPVMSNISSDTLIYLHDGAVVNAAIELIGMQNVKIAGTGIISLIDRVHGASDSFAHKRMWGAFRYHALPNIYIRSGCRNIEIEDVILNCEFRGIVLRNSEDISIKNVKMFTSAENADGINCCNTSNLTVNGCYIQSADDCFCMYNACDSIPTLGDAEYTGVRTVCRSVEVKNCIMSSNARPVVLGGHATGCKNPRCLIDGIYIHDLHIIETPYRIFGNTREYSQYWSGFLRLLSQSEQLVRNVRFENIIIDVTKGHNGKPVHIEVRDGKNASYTENQGYRIENISFKNICIRNHTEKLLPSLIKCREPVNTQDSCAISGVEFENFTIGGRPLAAKDVMLCGNTEGIKIIG